MKRIMRAAAILAVVLCAVSCARSILETPEDGGLPISLTPSFGHGQSEQSAATRVTSTDFEVGDALGLFVVADGRELALSGNVADNARMEVASSGAIEGAPRKVYYPNRSGRVSLYSYYPYDATIGGVSPYRFAAKVDQRLLVDYKASDFCYGTSLNVEPSASPRVANYSHKMSQLLINVTVPTSIGGKKVSSVESATLFSVENAADIDFRASGSVGRVATVVDTIAAYRDANVTTNASGSTTNFTAIIAPQQVASREVSSVALVGFVVKFQDNSTARYDYYNIDVLDIKPSAANTLNLTLGDAGTVILSGDPTVGPWASVSESGIITQPINNTFTAIWRLPVKEYKSVNRVVLGINDPISGTVKQFETTAYALGGDLADDKILASFKFVISAGDILAYPYTIDYVEFYEDQKLLQQCKSIISASVTRRGDYTLGIDRENVVAISVGKIEQWDDLMYGDILRGVDNDFRVSLIEYPHYADIATLKLRIDGETYTFNNAKCIAGSNQLVATTADVRFPDANGKAPYKYPFTIENVSFYDAAGSLVSDGSYQAAVSVNRAGLVTLRLYRGVITSPTATVTGYNTSGGAGRPDFGGAVENNPLRIVYCYGAATSQLSCMDVEKVELVVNNQTITLAGYKDLMVGTVLAAQSNSPHVNIATATGSKPTTYPYYISKITLRKADGTMLFSSALDVPLKVDWYGEVTIEIMEKMVANLPEYIEMNGIRWATGNLVADGKGGCKIGAPGDGGLYFQFGGLIGYKGGATGDGRGIPDSAKMNKKYWDGADAFSVNDVAVTPVGYGKPKDKWPYFDNYSAGGYGYYYYNTLASRGADFTVQPNGYDPYLGIGDPCRHYLGGDWRLPTDVEFATMTGTPTVDYNQALLWTDPSIAGKLTKTGPPATTIGAWFGPNSRTGAPTVTTDLFFPMNGYRQSISGFFEALNYGMNMHMCLVYDGTNLLNFNFNPSDGLRPRLSIGRTQGQAVRCVQGRKKVTEPIPPVASDIVVLNGLKWTKGNLVAAGPNNARVGAPGDGGLYFQYGGLIGYKGGATGDGTGMPSPELNSKYWWGFATAFSSNDVALAPSGYTKPTNVWPNFDNKASGGYGYYYYNNFITKYADFQKQANGKDIALGIGDPCELYLGSPWRMPNYMELSSVTGSVVEGSWIPWSDPSITGKWVVNGPSSSRTQGAWYGPNSRSGSPNVNTDLFIPASGYRYYVHGGFINVGVNGFVWSSSIYDRSNGFCLNSHELTGVVPRTVYNRAGGLPVRCVADDVVEIGGVKWAKGNLVANGPNSCVIGAPGDGGLYFQYGGLVGYKGGANGDGKGVVNVAKHPNDVFWNGATAYSANDISVTPIGYTSSTTTWPTFENKASGGFGYYYYNSFVTKYADFQTQANSTNIPQGIGDPCAHYLGSAWRLPTYVELSAITGNATEGSWVPWATAGVTGRWEKAGPQSALGAWFGPNSRTGTPTTATDLFITASGHRNTNGTFAQVGVNGYAWSSSVYDYYRGLHLSIHESAGVYPRIVLNRTQGFPVRCVKK